MNVRSPDHWCDALECNHSLFFDLDGTLIDPRDGIVRCFQYALEELGHASSPEAQLVRYIGPPLYETFPILLGTTDRDIIDKAVGLYRKRFGTEGIFENTLYPGITNALAALQARSYSLYVVTSKPTEFAQQIIEHFGLHPYFQSIYGSELDGTRANKEELIAHVLEQEQIRATNAVMIGDREHDIKGALANGVRPVGVLWGYGSRDELVLAGASALCETPGALAQYFR